MSDMRLPGAEMAIDSLRDLADSRRKRKQTSRDSFRWGLEQFLGQMQTKDAQKFASGEAEKGRTFQSEEAWKGRSHEYNLRVKELQDRYEQEKALLEARGAQATELEELRARHETDLKREEQAFRQNVEIPASMAETRVREGDKVGGKINEAVSLFMDSYYSDKTDFGRNYTPEEVESYIKKFLDAQENDGLLSKGQRVYAEELIRSRVLTATNAQSRVKPDLRAAGPYGKESEGAGIAYTPRKNPQESKISNAEWYKGIVTRLIGQVVKQATPDAQKDFQELQQLSADLQDGQVQPDFMQRIDRIFRKFGVSKPNAALSAEGEVY